MELLILPPSEAEIVEYDGDDAIVARHTGMPPSDAIIKVAHRVSNIHAASIKRSGMTFDDVALATETAFAMGHNPMTKDLHIWKMKGQVYISDHWAFLAGWAKSVESYREIQSTTFFNDGDDPYQWNWYTRLCLIRQSQDKFYSEMYHGTLQALLGSGVGATEAIPLAKQAAGDEFKWADGTCVYTEVYKYDNDKWVLNQDNTPKGWEPGKTRSYIRALRNAIKSAYGMPSSVERMNAGRANLAMVMRALDDIPVDVKARDVNDIIEQVERNRLPSLVKNGREVMNGPADEPIGDDWNTPLPDAPLQWWQLVKGTPEEIVEQSLDRANILNTEKKPNVRGETVAWLVGPEPGVRESRAVAWFCDALEGGKINGDRLLDFGVTPGDSATKSKSNLKAKMTEMLNASEF